MNSSKSSPPSVINCRALVCRGREEWKVEDVEVDPPLASEVRVRVLYASICHTDLLCSQGLPFPLYPRVLGHEGVGVVESVGEKVKDLKEGDVVMPLLVGECGECQHCTSGETNLCLVHPISFTGTMPDGTSRLHLPLPAAGGGGQRQPLYHCICCSTWAGTSWPTPLTSSNRQNSPYHTLASSPAGSRPVSGRPRWRPESRRDLPSPCSASVPSDSGYAHIEFFFPLNL
ncbi:hypothetical protein SAY87_008749 [Trapa incisa]|uniref:Alcohol dehydrogenase-like N-terminal domain-containing protein n=1 Tax=Trapa incisa TaxID=236973 RepID=A0AAN7JXM5_9MYRT|nr:hypothetical protein SAY87_008749 [Trapa incisa]